MWIRSQNYCYGLKKVPKCLIRVEDVDILPLSFYIVYTGEILIIRFSSKTWE